MYKHKLWNNEYVWQELKQEKSYVWRYYVRYIGSCPSVSHGKLSFFGWNEEKCVQTWLIERRGEGNKSMWVHIKIKSISIPLWIFFLFSSSVRIHLLRQKWIKFYWKSIKNDTHDISPNIHKTSLGSNKSERKGKSVEWWKEEWERRGKINIYFISYYDGTYKKSFFRIDDRFSGMDSKREISRMKKK